jgi:hypothetical protein
MSRSDFTGISLSGAIAAHRSAQNANPASSSELAKGPLKRVMDQSA